MNTPSAATPEELTHHTWHLCRVICKSHQGFKTYRADTIVCLTVNYMFHLHIKVTLAKTTLFTSSHCTLHLCQVGRTDGQQAKTIYLPVWWGGDIIIRMCKNMCAFNVTSCRCMSCLWASSSSSRVSCFKMSLKSSMYCLRSFSETRNEAEWKIACLCCLTLNYHHHFYYLSRYKYTWNIDQVTWR